MPSKIHLMYPMPIGHFRVLLCLCFKTSLSAKPFLWKWVLHPVSFSCKSKVIFIRMVSHLDSLWNRGTRELGNGLLVKLHVDLIPTHWERISQWLEQVFHFGDNVTFPYSSFSLGVVQWAAYIEIIIWLIFSESKDGTVARALASHQCVLGSIPGPGVICGLSLLMVLYSAPRGFSPGTPVFTSPQKPTFPNSNLIMIIAKHFIMSLWLGWLRKHSLCLTLILHLHFKNRYCKL